MRWSRLFTAGTLFLSVLLAATSNTIANTSRQNPAPRAAGSEALQTAAQLVQQGRLDEAERQARRALSDPVTEAAAYSVLGTISFQRQRFDESILRFKKAIQLNDRLLGAHLTLAEIYMRQGKPALAEPLFERVLKLDPSNVAARMALARSGAEKGD